MFLLLIGAVHAAALAGGNAVTRRSAISGAAACAITGASATPPAIAAGTSSSIITPAESGLIAGGPLPLTVGQGTCLVRPGQAQNIVKLGLQCGYRVFDTAQRYGNEAGVGKAIREAAGSIKREQVFVTTKIWVDNMGQERASASVRESADALGLDGGIDLVLIHWPGKFIKRGDPENDRTNRELRAETWAALETLKRDGVVRNIGVSNFSERHLKELLAFATVKPSVNQFECHPYNQRRALVDLCQGQGISCMSYCPLGGRGNKGQVTDELLKDAKILAIAKERDLTAAQVILRWHLQRGLTPIPKASSKVHLAENIDCYGFELSSNEMATIDRLNRDKFALFDADVLA